MSKPLLTSKRRVWAKRWLIPYGLAVVVAFVCAPIWRTVGGPTVLGLPWWFLPIEAALVLFACWWTFIHCAPAKAQPFRCSECRCPPNCCCCGPDHCYCSLPELRVDDGFGV